MDSFLREPREDKHSKRKMPMCAIRQSELEVGHFRRTSERCNQKDRSRRNFGGKGCHMICKTGGLYEKTKTHDHFWRWGASACVQGELSKLRYGDIVSQSEIANRSICIVLESCLHPIRQGRSPPLFLTPICRKLTIALILPFHPIPLRPSPQPNPIQPRAIPEHPPPIPLRRLAIPILLRR